VLEKAAVQRFGYHRSAMHTTRRHTFTHRHLVWLLWLVLLLPMAQTAATWHVLSHLPSNQADENDGKQAIHQDRCALCLSAAALIGGAPLVSAPHLPPARAFHEAALVELHGILLTAVRRAYDSRAPPFPLH
jgi:hypothetical protein